VIDINDESFLVSYLFRDYFYIFYLLNLNNLNNNTQNITIYYNKAVINIKNNIS